MDFGSIIRRFEPFLPSYGQSLSQSAENGQDRHRGRRPDHRLLPVCTPLQPVEQGDTDPGDAGGYPYAGGHVQANRNPSFDRGARLIADVGPSHSAADDLGNDDRQAGGDPHKGSGNSNRETNRSPDATRADYSTTYSHADRCSKADPCSNREL